MILIPAVGLVDRSMGQIINDLSSFIGGAGVFALDLQLVPVVHQIFIIRMRLGIVRDRPGTPILCTGHGSIINGFGVIGICIGENR